MGSVTDVCVVILDDVSPVPVVPDDVTVALGTGWMERMGPSSEGCGEGVEKWAPMGNILERPTAEMGGEISLGPARCLRRPSDEMEPEYAREAPLPERACE